MAKHNTRDANDLLQNLDPSVQDKVLQDDVNKAQKVRETFLSYRAQLVASLKILDKHSDQNDETAKQMAQEVQGLLMVLDKLEKRKRVTADTLLDFMSQMRSIGGKLNATADDKNNKSALAEELRRQKQESLEDDKKQDERFASLAEKIGQPLDKFIKGNAELIGTGGGSALKVAMAAWLGPAAPLVKLVDDLIDIDGKVAKAYNGTVDLAKKTLKATVGAPSKLIKAGGEWAATTLNWMKSRARDEDNGDQRQNKRLAAFMREQINNLKDMRKKLGRLGGGVAAAIGSVLSGLIGIISKSIGGLGSILKKVLGGLMGGAAARAAGGAVIDRMRKGAGKIFRKGGQKVGDAARSTKSFMSKALANGKNAIKVGGKALGAAGGAYGMYDGYNTIRDNKDKGFFESGEGGVLDSRAGGYGSSIAGGAAVGATIGSVVPVVGTVVGGIVGGAVGGLSALVADNQDAITAALSSATDKAKDFGQKIMDKAKEGMTNLGASVAGIKGSLLSTGETLNKWSGSVGDWLKTTVSSITDSVASAVSNGISAASELISSSIGKISDVVGGIVSKVGDVVSGAFTKMGDWLSDAGLGKAVDWGREKAKAVADTYQDTKKAATEAVTGAWAKVSGWFDEAKTSLSGAASEATTKATAVALNVATSAKNAVQAGTGVNLASVLPDSARKAIVQAKAGANYESVKGEIAGASKATGVGAGTLARFAQIESGFNPNAKAGTSSAGGLYQFIDSTWQEQLKKHGAKYGLDANTSKFDPRANALLGAEYIKSNKETLAKVTGGEVNDTQLYLAHFLGAGGASQFFKAMQQNPDAPAAATMTAAAKANPSIFYDGSKARSFKEVYGLMARKVAKTDDIAARADADAGQANGSMIAKNDPTVAPGSAAAPTATAQPVPASIGGSTATPLTSNTNGSVVGGSPAGASTTVAGQAIPSVTTAAVPMRTTLPLPGAPTSEPVVGKAQVVASNDVHYIPKSTVPPTVNAEGADSKAGSSGPTGTGGMKSSLSQIPFTPDDQNLLAFNIVGIIG